MNAQVHIVLSASLLLGATNVAMNRDAYAAECNGSGSAADSVLNVGMTCANPTSLGEAEDGGAAPASAPENAPPALHIKYQWASVCAGAGPDDVAGTSADCGQARTCPDPAQRLWRLWALRPSGDWASLGVQCSGQPPPPPPAAAADPPKPQVTPGLVLTALRRMGLPPLTAHTQPKDKTLVNFATIFYTDPQPFVRSITLLGQPVQVQATPISFTWHYGDGSSTTTSSPGAPYPAMDVTHSYSDAHVTVQASVDTTYSARFRVGNGAWQDIPETVTIAGPASGLRISEATAVLSGHYE